MIKIALIRNVSPKNHYGGIRKHCDALFSLFKNDESIQILPIKNIQGGEVPFIKKRYFKFKDIYDYIKKTNADILHIHGFATFDVIQSILIAKIFNKKIIYSPHFHPFEYLQRPLLGKIYFYLFIRPLLSFVSFIVTISNTDTNFFKKYHKRIVRIPHQFDSYIKKNDNIRTNNMILFVGRNEENKGIDHLYCIPLQYEVHCVTKGNLERKDFIIHSNISNEELDSLYSKAALVVIPSRYEAFSYVALEAFAHGTPVVMSDTVKIADYLIDLKGFSTFTYSNKNEFVKAIQQTIGTEVEVDSILEQFKPEVIKDLYKKLYINTINLL